MTTPATIHATAVAVGGRAILIMGPPGSGKSSLALALIDQPGYGLGPELLRAALIADDRTILTRDGGALIASCPDPLKGLIEIRGLGVLKCASVDSAPAALAIHLGREPDRLPDPDWFAHEGLRIPAAAMMRPCPATVRAALLLHRELL